MCTAYYKKLKRSMEINNNSPNILIIIWETDASSFKYDFNIMWTIINNFVTLFYHFNFLMKHSTFKLGQSTMQTYFMHFFIFLPGAVDKYQLIKEFPLTKTIWNRKETVLLFQGKVKKFHVNWTDIKLGTRNKH